MAFRVTGAVVGRTVITDVTSDRGAAPPIPASRLDSVTTAPDSLLRSEVAGASSLPANGHTVTVASLADSTSQVSDRGDAGDQSTATAGAVGQSSVASTVDNYRWTLDASLKSDRVGFQWYW